MIGNTNFLIFFSEKRPSPWKSTSRQKKRFFDNRLEIHRQSLTILRLRAGKNRKPSFFQKNEMSLKTFFWAQRRLFEYHPKKRQKKLKFRWKSEQNYSLDFFSGEHVFPQKVPTEAHSRVLTTVLMFFRQIAILSSKIYKKTALDFGENLPNSFQEKTFT